MNDKNFLKYNIGAYEMNRRKWYVLEGKTEHRTVDFIINKTNKIRTEDLLQLDNICRCFSIPKE